MKKVALLILAASALSGCETVGGPGVSTFFDCDRGVMLKVDNLGSRTIFVSVNRGRPLRLHQTPAASGVAWEGGGYRLQTKGPEAVWSGRTREAPYRCRQVAVPR